MPGLPRAFVSFSSTDIRDYWLMQAWRKNKEIDFSFADYQLPKALESEDEHYIKRKCRERINSASRFVMLIGQDTRRKHKYVRWEAEVALEKGCTIIGVNLNGLRGVDQDLCPPIIRDVGAIFVSFSARIIAHAIAEYSMRDKGAWYYKPDLYSSLGLGETPVLRRPSSKNALAALPSGRGLLNALSSAPSTLPKRPTGLLGLDRVNAFNSTTPLPRRTPNSIRRQLLWPVNDN